MAKSFFRFLRGELNGFYITSFYKAFNKSTEEIRDFLAGLKLQQFEEGQISDENLYGLGKFAGVFLPRISQAESLTAIRMSESKELNGVEYSERGLFYIPLEYFNFYHMNLDSEGEYFFEHTTQEEYDEDINELALDERKSSLVGDEELLGYIADDVTDLFNADGTVNMDKVTSTPPQGKAYSRFYGDQFSFLSEGTEDKLDQTVRVTLTESYEVDGEEYSERGLYKPPVPDYDDINTLATPLERSSLIGDEDEVLGYLYSSDTNILDDEGNVKPEFIHENPPSGNEAYTEYYGDRFLLLAEGDLVYTKINTELFMDLYKALQKIRYNGASISSLASIIEILCSGLVEIDRIESGIDNACFYVYYNYYGDAKDITYKGQRKALLEFLVAEKFKQVVLIENL